MFIALTDDKNGIYVCVLGEERYTNKKFIVDREMLFLNVTDNSEVYVNLIHNLIEFEGIKLTGIDGGFCGICQDENDFRIFHVFNMSILNKNDNISAITVFFEGGTFISNALGSANVETTINNWLNSVDERELQFGELYERFKMEFKENIFVKSECSIWSGNQTHNCYIWRSASIVMILL